MGEKLPNLVSLFFAQNVKVEPRLNNKKVRIMRKWKGHTLWNIIITTRNIKLISGILYTLIKFSDYWVLSKSSTFYLRYLVALRVMSLITALLDLPRVSTIKMYFGRKFRWRLKARKVFVFFLSLRRRKIQLWQNFSVLFLIESYVVDTQRMWILVITRQTHSRCHQGPMLWFL
jgi:hypothetical protein